MADEDANLRAALRKAGRDPLSATRTANGLITINVYFHIIRSTVGGGVVTPG